MYLKASADKMHAELLRQCDALMGAEAGTDEAAALERISRIVSEYEDVRWPIDHPETATEPGPMTCACKHDDDGIPIALCGAHQLIVDRRVAAEREASAKIADAWTASNFDGCAEAIRDAIRNRSS